MSIREIHARTLGEALGALEDLELAGGVIFRGHSNVCWRLSSTLARWTVIPHEGWSTQIDDLQTQFLEGLASVGQLPTSLDLKDRRSRLEYARHFGVPSPLIDFTYSPYVATFFTFNGTRQDPTKPDDEVVVYALCIDELAFHWASRGRTFDPEERHRFLHEARQPLFRDGYPAGLLKFMGSPASWNTRMQRQIGVFLYDTLDHKGSDLERFVEQITEHADSKIPALTKVFIPKSISREIFERLELMGMTGARLLDDYVGAAADVYNSYHYDRRTRTWDLMMPPPDDTKL